MLKQEELPDMPNYVQASNDQVRASRDKTGLSSQTRNQADPSKATTKLIEEAVEASQVATQMRRKSDSMHMMDQSSITGLNESLPNNYQVSFDYN